MDASLTPFFNPQGVVVVGASTNPVKPGYGVARNLVNSGYRGAIHFVSQKEGELFGRPIYTSVAEVPDPVDLAVIIVPAPAVPQALEACGGRGIRAAIILAGGFREVGPEGEALEAEVMRIARAYGIRIVGPNCVGLTDAYLPLDTSFLPEPAPPKGNVAIVSQSGAMLLVMIDWARSEGLGFSRLMSLGNKADVVEADVLEAAVGDAQTAVLALYIEALVDGPRFIAEARKAARRKPLVGLKVGRYSAGQRAAASHTGALAGSDAAYAAAFDRAGILRAETSEELFDLIMAFSYCPLPAGRRVAILTNAGGPGVIASDAVEACGLELAKLSEKTVAALKEFLPPAANFHNPVDMLGGSLPQDYSRSLQLLLDDPGVDSVMVILPAPPMCRAEEVADAIIPLIKATSKPVVVNLLGQMLVSEALGRFRRAQVAAYPFGERAAMALAGLTRRAEFERSPDLPLPDPAGIDRQAAARALETAVPGAWLDPESADRLLTAYGIPTAAVKLARSPAEAAELAARLGFPVAVKVASADIPHKSDVGGVVLGVGTAEAAAEAFRAVTERAQAAIPTARLEGVHIQRMLPPGQEVIVGAARDPVFGPLMMFGSGGVEVEGLKDVAFDLAPLAEAHAERLLARTWAGRKLAGFRSIPPGDAAAVKEVLIRLSCLARDFPQISEIEINPLRVLAPGAGAVAVDVRVKQ
ncbi:MAG: acetate--CoA ligase family protein [Anaerolineales bacterium]